MNEKWNLVFIFTDQQRYDTLRVYGNEKIKMPNLNGLAERSAVFKQAYVTQPVCTPSRASIMTGLYPHNHGSIENNTHLHPSIPALPELLSNRNYRSAYIGKWHLGDEIICQHGFDEWVSIEDNYRKYYSDEKYKQQNCSYFHFLKEQGFLPDVEHGDFSYFSREFSTRLPEQFSKPAFLANEADRFISDNKANNFILYVNFLEPHPPYYSAFDELYNPDEIELPPLFQEDVPANTPLKYKYNQIYHRDVGRHYPMKDENVWRKLIARYWGANTLVDKYAGEILASLQRNGLDDKTIIVFTSDHGDMMGDFQMLQKYVMYESATRIPLLIRIPHVTDEQIIIDQPVSQIDLVPTLLEILGQPNQHLLDGKSIYRHITGEEGLRDNDVFIEWNGDEGEHLWFSAYQNSELKDKIDRVYGAAVRTVVTPEGWKLSLSQSGEHELYNLSKDPYELCNLYFSDEHKNEIVTLSEKIFAWQQRTKDTLLLKV